MNKCDSVKAPTPTPSSGLSMAYKYNAADWARYNKPFWLFSYEGV